MDEAIIAQLREENEALKAKLADMEIAFGQYVLSHSSGCDQCLYEFDETCPGCTNKKNCWKWNGKAAGG